jgi:hypothetical protein
MGRKQMMQRCVAIRLLLLLLLLLRATTLPRNINLARLTQLTEEEERAVNKRNGME